jgi:Spy/CpxP family protein refolding chaperone
MSQIDSEDLRFTPKAMEILRKAESELRTKVYIAVLQKLKSEQRNEVTPDDVHYALAKALEQMAAAAADI